MNALITILDPPFLELTYSLIPSFPDSFWQYGLRVAVPLGKGAVKAGLITKLDVEAPSGVTLKEIIWPLETTPLVPKGLLDMLTDLANQACAKPGAAMALMLPFLKETKIKLHRLTPHDALTSKDRFKSLQQLRSASPQLRSLYAHEMLTGQATLVPPRHDAAENERCVLLVSPPWPVRPYATQQIQALEYLAKHGTTQRRRLIRALGANGSQTIFALQKANCIRIEHDSNEGDTELRIDQINEQLIQAEQQNFRLNDDQESAVQALLALLPRTEPAYRLLYGVTGSGKTAVYLALAKEALKQGISVLLLAPEVALAHKLRKDVALALPEVERSNALFFYHGYQSQSQKERTFRILAARTTPCLVVGTRSALFLPIPELGCIILDEEHDASFKQEDHVPYQAKSIAWFKMLKEKGLLVLGSATPDLKTWYASQQGVLPTLWLPKRVSNRPLPPVELLSIGKRQIIDDNTLPTTIAPAAIAALEETLGRGEQAVVLLNRRGFSPSIYCPDCQETLQCPSCAVSLSYHKELGKLLCHYCGYTLDFPTPCPHCHNLNFMPVGEGTERVSEYLAARFGQDVLRLDRDSTRHQGAMEEILSRFAQHEAHILVGTQMLSKGHHFPEVTLAVIADGDLGLNLPDYMAAEKTFQLLVQASGRAGRGEKPGRVLIQTRHIDHYCWQYICNADYEGFYAEEIQRRQKYLFPPFVKLGMIRFSYDRSNLAAAEAMQEFGAFIRSKAASFGLLVRGPSDAPIACIADRMRFQCLLKGHDWQSMRKFYVMLSQTPFAQKIRIQLNLDPINML